MKNLKDFIIESMKGFYSIYKACEDISGRTTSNKAKSIIDEINNYLDSNKHEDITFEDFEKNAKDGKYYILHDEESYLICINEGHSFNVAYLFKTDKLLNVYGKDNNYEVYGNLHYGIKNILELKEKYFDKSKMKIVSTKFKI